MYQGISGTMKTQHGRRRRAGVTPLRALAWATSATLAVMAALAPSSGSLVRAATSEPVYGATGIVVDGIRTDWQGTSPFASMYRAAKPDKPVESTLFLRYDCATGTLLAMVETVADVVLQPGGDDFVKVDGAKLAGSPDLGDYEQSADGLGWEASVPLAAGSYDLNVHAAVLDGGAQTSAVAGRSIPLTIVCRSSKVTAPSTDPSASPSVPPYGEPDFGGDPDPHDQVNGPRGICGCDPVPTPAAADTTTSPVTATVDPTLTPAIGNTAVDPSPATYRGVVLAIVGTPKVTLPPTDAAPVAPAVPATGTCGLRFSSLRSSWPAWPSGRWAACAVRRGTALADDTRPTALSPGARGRDAISRIPAVLPPPSAQGDAVSRRHERDRTLEPGANGFERRRRVVAHLEVGQEDPAGMGGRRELGDRGAVEVELVDGDRPRPERHLGEENVARPDEGCDVQRPATVPRVDQSGPRLTRDRDAQGMAVRRVGDAPGLELERADAREAVGEGHHVEGGSDEAGLPVQRIESLFEAVGRVDRHTSGRRELEAQVVPERDQVDEVVRVQMAHDDAEERAGFELARQGGEHPLTQIEDEGFAPGLEQVGRPERSGPVRVRGAGAEHRQLHAGPGRVVMVAASLPYRGEAGGVACDGARPPGSAAETPG